MAVESLVRLTCDRCGSTMEEGPEPSVGQEEAPVQLTIEGELAGKEASFYDVCEKCCERIKNLLNQLTLAPKEKNGEDKPKRKPKPKTPEATVTEENVEAPN